MYKPLNSKLISYGISSYDELVSEYQVTYLAGSAAQKLLEVLR